MKSNSISTFLFIAGCLLILIKEKATFILSFICDFTHLCYTELLVSHWERLFFDENNYSIFDSFELE